MTPHRQTYVCPRCHEKFEVMDIYRLSNGDRSFCCSHCCPNDDHSGCKKGSGYTLEDFEDKKGLDSVQALVVLLNEQLGQSTNPLSFVFFVCFFCLRCVSSFLWFLFRFRFFTPVQWWAHTRERIFLVF